MVVGPSHSIPHGMNWNVTTADWCGIFLSSLRTWGPPRVLKIANFEGPMILRVIDPSTSKRLQVSPIRSKPPQQLLTEVPLVKHGYSQPSLVWGNGGRELWCRWEARIGCNMCINHKWICELDMICFRDFLGFILDGPH